MSNQTVDEALDAVLKAAGTALKNYSGSWTLDKMRDAMRKAMSDSYIAGSNACADILQDSRSREAELMAEIDFKNKIIEQHERKLSACHDQRIESSKQLSNRGEALTACEDECGTLHAEIERLKSELGTTQKRLSKASQSESKLRWLIYDVENYTANQIKEAHEFAQDMYDSSCAQANVANTVRMQLGLETLPVNLVGKSESNMVTQLQQQLQTANSEIESLKSDITRREANRIENSKFTIKTFKELVDSEFASESMADELEDHYAHIDECHGLIQKQKKQLDTLKQKVSEHNDEQSVRCDSGCRQRHWSEDMCSGCPKYNMIDMGERHE